MKKGILLLLLLLPAVIYLFLRVFGNNNFVVPVYYIDGKSVNASVHTVKPFVANDVNGKRVKSKSLQPYLKVIHFVNPDLNDEKEGVATEHLLRMLGNLSKDDPIRVISFDRSQADHKVLKKFYDEFNDDKRWHLLSLSADSVNDLAKNSYRLNEDSTFTTLKAFSHKAVLVDTLSRIRGYYDLTKQKEADRLTREIYIILDKKLYK